MSQRSRLKHGIQRGKRFQQKAVKLSVSKRHCRVRNGPPSASSIGEDFGAMVYSGVGQIQ